MRRSQRAPRTIAQIWLLLAVSLTVAPTSLGHAQTDQRVVSVWLTTQDLTNTLTQQPDIALNSAQGADGAPTVVVDERTPLQPIAGFGVAITDSSASVISSSTSPAQRSALLRGLFSPVDGIGPGVVRVPMGASDFTVSGFYSYDDLEPGQTDPTLAHFSVAHDAHTILPVLHEIQALNPSMKLIAAPWSPPAWMKSNATMLGTRAGVSGRLLPAAYAPLAQYFVRFIQAYQAEGLPIYAITPQNEPLYAPASYPGMLMSVTEQSTFISAYLAPALAQANLHPRILAYDYNWDTPSYVRVLLRDAGVAANIAGIARHCYAGNPRVMSEIRAEFPTKEVHETECAPSAASISTMELFFGAVQHWASTVTLLNAALDPTYGPHTGGCDNCAPLVIVDPASGQVTYPLEFYQVGHFSKFVSDGALHLETTSTPACLRPAAFRNPDGTLTLVAENPGDSDCVFRVLDGTSEWFGYALPAGAIATFVWTASSSL